ncbi:MAG: SLATT domain-containing protein [Cyanobacteria bacterium P01_H01_bin.152]
MGVPTIIISTLIGTTIFASLGSSQKIYIQIAVGLMSLSAAILSSLQTFLDYSELAGKHKQASIKYGELRREMEQVLVENLDEEKQSHFMKAFSAKWNALDTDSPTIPNKVYSKVASRILGTHKGVFKR